ncbi:uncharacterized protein LOC107460337 [Arachis duranensis]|uniref:Uncharacterized protein LOC107460337 n=1 Tax=Arachis duranensis TaxID=130453 RepID=A0A6P4B9D4_ARADU|nr:uncharacterized protein LOC107460337 [Arachis duranensis]
MVYRAVVEAREKIMGNERDQYKRSRDYCEQILLSNPSSTARLELMPIPESPPIFDKLYICLDACKKGFKDGCRPLLHLDGCFLKTYYMGWLLAAVAQDANNQFYVVAYGVVRGETKDAWKWFLTNLQEDIGDSASHGWTFISDQQKGLLPALKEVMPHAKLRNCVMHMWKNFINRFKDLYIRKVVWECARCTTIAEFKECMDKLKQVNHGAWEYLSRFPPESWVKTYFSHAPKIDNLTNNMCEVFNAKIVTYRTKPILTMCEEIRCYLMRRMVNHKRVLDNHTEKLAPVQQKRMERLLSLSTKWMAEWVGDNERKRFEVSRKASKVDVDLIKYTCSCNKWQLTSMPCIHALAAIRKRRDQPQDYVHPWLCMESIRRIYAHCIQPVPSSEFWARTEFTQPDPPIIKRGIGRPKVHNRQKDPAEPMMQGGKLKKSFSVSCNKCGEKGHNYKTCKGAPSNPNWKPKTKKPKKKKESTSQALEPSHSQPPSSTPQQQQPTVPSGAGPTATNVAPAPTRVTRSTIVLGPPAPTGSSKIFRPPAPLAQGPPPSSTQHQEAVHQAPSSTQAATQPQQAPPPQADKPTVSASKESNK